MTPKEREVKERRDRIKRKEEGYEGTNRYEGIEV